MNQRRIAASRLAPNVLWLRAMLPRALAIGVCAAFAASCSGGSGTPDAGAGGSAGGTTGLAGSSGGRGGGGGSVGGGGGASAGTGGAAGAAGQGGDAGGRGGGAGGSGGVGVCGFASTYTISDGGSGLAFSFDTVTLSPPNAFRYERQYFGQDAGTISCMPAVPACADPTPHIDASQVEAAIAHPDVQAALALTTRPVYGERGVADGPMFMFTRADARGFNASIACNVPSATCMPIPAGVSALMQVVRMLVDQQLGDTTCAQLR